MSPGKERCLLKESVTKWRRQNTQLFYERRKSAGEHASYAIVMKSLHHHAIQSRRRRWLLEAKERERMMMMENKRGVEPYA